MADEKSEHSMQLENEKYHYSRIDCESFILRKTLGKPANKEIIDITASRAIFGTGHLSGGSLSFLSNTGVVTPGSELFGIFLPPHSIYRTRCDFKQLNLSLVVSSNADVVTRSSHPVIFPTTVEDFTGSSVQIEALLSELSEGGAAVLDCREAPPAAAAKKIIDEQFSEIYRISTLARLIGIESWELSRMFKSSYGLSPLKYLNYIRTIEALYRLLDDERKSKIIDIAFNVGFRDLSRFNKQFKSFVRFIPKNLRPKKN